MSEKHTSMDEEPHTGQPLLWKEDEECGSESSSSTLWGEGILPEGGRNIRKSPAARASVILRLSTPALGFVALAALLLTSVGLGWSLHARMSPDAKSCVNLDGWGDLPLSVMLLKMN
jgi:hypothetical protein